MIRQLPGFISTREEVFDFLVGCMGELRTWRDSGRTAAPGRTARPQPGRPSRRSSGGRPRCAAGVHDRRRDRGKIRPPGRDGRRRLAPPQTGSGDRRHRDVPLCRPGAHNSWMLGPTGHRRGVCPLAEVKTDRHRRHLPPRHPQFHAEGIAGNGGERVGCRQRRPDAHGAGGALHHWR